MLDLKDIPSLSVTPAGEALAAQLVSETELLRLKAIAHLHARGLPSGISGSDLLQEAFTRILDGSRRRPPEISMVAFVSGIMRSLRSDHWRRARLESNSADLFASRQDAAPDPERSLAALQELNAIAELFAEDPEVQEILAGIADQRAPEEIRAAAHLSKTQYDSALKRMRRVFLREGLKWRPL